MDLKTDTYEYMHLYSLCICDNSIHRFTMTTAYTHATADTQSPWQQHTHISCAESVTTADTPSLEGATHCNTLQLPWPRRATRVTTATYCNILQHTGESVTTAYHHLLEAATDMRRRRIKKMGLSYFYATRCSLPYYRDGLKFTFLAALCPKCCNDRSP